jgi:hypothetical protein
MDISTGNWFEYLREEVLTEGLRDIGLPESVVDFIEEAMPKSPEKAKVYAGNHWKKGINGTAGTVQALQFTAVNHLIDQYGDYVIADKLSRDGRPTDVAARTVAPYDVRGMEDGPPEERVMYDDERIKQAEQVKFVIQNIKNVLNKPMGTWSKAFKKAVKALSKAGIPSEKVESTQEYFKALLQQEFQNWWYRWDLLFAWLNSEPTNYELIKGESTLGDAYDVAQEDLNNREDPEMIIHQFDDGSYWYNLDVSNCAVEGERMGHCGGDSRGTLVSLRKKQGKRKASSSYITMTWADEDLYQIKGRSNDAPPNEMWDHIDWFIKNMGITAVHESGEHSNDYDGFREMNDYLSTQNRGVSFEGAVDIEAIDEALREIEANYDGEQTSISAEASGPDEHGGDAGVYVSMSGYASMEIELRWKGFRDKDGFYIPTLAPDDNTPDPNLSPIPINSWGTEAREFDDECGFDALGWDMAGEEAEVEWSMEMKEGSHPPDYEGDFGAEGPQMATLRVEWRTSTTDTAEDADDASRVFESFASEMQNFDENYEDHYAEVRGKMAQHGYIAKTTYDRDREEMAAYDMDHWKVWSEKSGLEFWFRPHRQSDSLVNSGGDTARIPMEIMMWGFDQDRGGHIEGLFSRMFGSSAHGRPPRIENADLNRNMARNLEKLYAGQEASNPGQETLPFGQEYEAAPPHAVLAKDSRFVIQPETRYGRSGDVGEGSYPEMPIQWRYTIGVDHTASTEEVQAVKDIVKYFNENPEMVQEAAMKTIRDAMASVAALADVTKESVMSGKWPQNAIQKIDSQNHAAAMSGSDVWAERRIMIAKWIKENFDQMGEPEKYVAWFKYLSPIKDNRFNMARSGDIEMDDNDNLGMPKSWTKEVQDQMKKMKAFSGSVRNYSGIPKGETMAGTLGEPQPAGGPIVRNARGERMTESVEQQIDRVERLLSEEADIRLYKIIIRTRVDSGRSKKTKLLHDQLRGLVNVTTVNPIIKRPLSGGQQVWFDIKFTLEGTESRDRYIEDILIPLMRRVQGVQVDAWGPADEVTPGKHLPEAIDLKEYGFGGVRYPAPVQTSPLHTPRMMLASIVQDWVDGGVMAYDTAMDSTDMQYHVMMPVEELLPLISREFRAPKDAFDGMYHHFIEKGATAPVFIAIGKNGRIKCTGNEDLIWFAKRSGQQELPVFFSYQRQV